MSTFRTLTIGPLLALLVAGIGATSAVAQDEPLGELLDVVSMPPEQVVIERVLTGNGVVVIDGDEYRLDPELLRSAERANPPGPPVEIKDLEAGMTVWMVTDGLEAMRGQRPAILGLWRAQ